MEASLLFTMSQIYGLRAGAVCAVFANRVTNELAEVGEENAIKVANLAAHLLQEMDEEKEQAGKKFWYPSLRRK